MEQVTVDSFLEAERLDKQDFIEQIHRDFSKHQLRTPPECKSWSIGKPDHFCYGFRIVWLPGALHLSGDLDELTVVHYVAMPTWAQAVNWVAGAHFDYLLSKSTAQKDFNQRKTVAELLRRADEQLEHSGSSDEWEHIFAYLDGFFSQGNVFDAQAHDPMRPEDRAEAATLLLDEAYLDFSPETLYHSFDEIDWNGVYDYKPQARWQYEALQLWARLVRETDEFKQQGEIEHG